MTWTNFVLMLEGVDWYSVATIGGPWALAFVVYLVVLRYERRKAEDLRSLLSEGREVLSRIKEDRQSVEWLLGRMKEKIEEKREKDSQKRAVAEVETTLDSILAEHPQAHAAWDWEKEERPTDRYIPHKLDFTQPTGPGLTMGDAGARMDEALAPRRRRMVEVQNTDLGDAWVVPAEDAEKLSKIICVRGERLRGTAEEEEAMRTKFREDVQAGREIPF